MEKIYLRLPKVEQIPIKLRDAYERYGYVKYRMAKFEPYDLYREHKGFLKSEGILTFNDKKGRLLALKPDVTISIVNSVKPEDKEGKFFYVENVYRAESGEYVEINQIGLEYIGGNSLYAETEVICLAYKSLEAISDNFVLNIGHTGIWSACFDYLKIADKTRELILSKIKNKNLHELKSVAESSGIDGAGVELLVSLAKISENIDKGIEKLQSISKNLNIENILSELKTVREALKTLGMSKINLDLSVLNDLTYYNGVLFQGFVEGLSKVLLAGGRYDNLMKSFGKSQRAVGFAIYTEELQRALIVGEKKPEVSEVRTNSVVDALVEVSKIADSGKIAKANVQE